MTDETQEQDQETMEGESMEALLKEHTDFQDKLAKREVVWVKVVQVGSEQVLVDIGEKNEAVIPLSEFPADDKPVAGRRVPAVLVKKGRGDAPTALSAEKARWQLGWDGVVKAHAEKARVGQVEARSRQLGRVGGVLGFMPSPTDSRCGRTI